MTLGFKQEIGGKPTYFAEKIIAGLPLADSEIMTLMDSLGDVVPWTDAEFMAGSCNPCFNHVPKLHTIREDIKCLWKSGKLIHPVINNRTENRYQFAPVMKCVSVQEIIISRDLNTVYVDSTRLMSNQVKQLAINDGFDGIDDFFDYFRKTFYGKIIHWTDLRY